MEEEFENLGKKCEWCRDELEYAAYVWAVLDGAMGGTGFVAPPYKDDWPLFCSKNCALQYLRAEEFGAVAIEKPRMP